MLSGKDLGSLKYESVYDLIGLLVREEILIMLSCWEFMKVWMENV